MLSKIASGRPRECGGLVGMRLRLIGVPFDSYGRDGAVARAPVVLRSAGLADRLRGRHEVAEAKDLSLPGAVAERSPASGLLNEKALSVMTAALRSAVGLALASGQFPLVYGSDCAILLGALAGLRDRAGKAALLFVDGHEDAFPLESSPDGQAADSEIALALGLTGATAPAGIRDLLPLVAPARLAMLGPRNGAELAAMGVPSLRGTVFHRTDLELLASDAREIAGEAIADALGDGRFWLHTDLDVLTSEAFSAQDFPEPGGISWPCLQAIAAEALSSTRCAGWSVVIYNPDLDPGQTAARRIVQFIAAALPPGPTPSSPLR
jgi:arginase